MNPGGPERDEEGSLTEDEAALELAEGEGMEAPESADPADAEAPTEEELPPLIGVLEAALFASAEPVPLTRLVRTLGAWSRSQIASALGELATRLETEQSGVRLVETAGGFQLRSAEVYAPWVRRFFAEKPPRLSRAVLETLAVAAYRQPVTRGEIESVRGVNCDAVLGTLIARGLLQIQGRRLSPGRPVEYGTTREFLELFSLRDLNELPPLPDPTVLANLIVSEEGAAESESGDFDAADGALAEDLEPGGDCLEEGGGGADPGGAGPGEREGHPGAGSESGSDPGPDHG